MSTTPIMLALQGNGAHGAFTWGVLDRLLDEEQLEIEAVSGTGAGALNGTVLAMGLLEGRAAAKAALAAFWHRIGEIGGAAFNPYESTPLHAMARAWNLDWAPAGVWLDTLAQFASPYQLNPLDDNPLRELLLSSIDPARLAEQNAIRLFVAATNLQTNRLRMFVNEQISIDALLASACLPQRHRAVMIDGAYYWDGSYLGNPVLKPLLNTASARDIVLVQLHPLQRVVLPITARDITDRLNEVTMNAALMHELQGIRTINKLLAAKAIEEGAYRTIHFHRIADEEMMRTLGLSSKTNTARSFLTYLRQAGWSAADRWLVDHREMIGRKTSFDLAEFTI